MYDKSGVDATIGCTAGVIFRNYRYFFPKLEKLPEIRLKTVTTYIFRKPEAGDGQLRVVRVPLLKLASAIAFKK